jgi:hypothetical protein
MIEARSCGQLQGRSVADANPVVSRNGRVA